MLEPWATYMCSEEQTLSASMWFRLSPDIPIRALKRQFGRYLVPAAGYMCTVKRIPETPKKDETQSMTGRVCA